MILSLVDSELDYVMANAEFNDKDVDVFSSSLMKFANGVRGAFNVGMIFNPQQNGRKDMLYIHGSKGIISSDVEYNQEGDLSYIIISDGKRIDRTVHAAQNYSLEIEQLGRCIENGETPHITEEFSVRNAGLLDTILSKIGY